ncbi:uncharacterized protein L201_006473 [Kwoniella dendrophila CBS 6074]|uniref:Peroxin-14 n=1 Tax=Kwoniella dendrophila CBS 6074 TaxID=1295534 RepID=A0AAX4K3T7_9TREE
MSENNNDNNNNNPSNADDPTNNPLFGAPPPNEASTSQIQPLQPQSGDTAINQSTVVEGTSNPLYGAVVPQDANTDWRLPAYQSTGSRSIQYNQPIPREFRLYHGPRSIQPSKTIQFIKRITFIVSIFLGLSASIAGIWSIFILPLLHSTFSARNAILNQQTERVKSLVEGLSKLKKLKMYSSIKLPDSSNNNNNINIGTKEEKIDEKQHEHEHENEHEHEEANLKEISDSISSLKSNSNSDFNSSKKQIQTSSSNNNGEEEEEFNSIPISQLDILSSKLNLLSTAINSTSTTRTSLISTLESYTSNIHRQLFISRPQQGGFTNYSIGMNSLSNHLNQPQNNDIHNYGLGGVKPEQWDQTRKEIRAIKGLLLNRRQFAKPQ